MKDIHIAGTGIWYPEDTISNDEIVLSFNSYVDNFNSNNINYLGAGNITTRHQTGKRYHNIIDVL